MTESEKESILWLRDVAGAKLVELSPDGSPYRIEFWNAPQLAQPKFDIAAVLGAAVTDDELYGYEVPEHLKDPDDVTQEEKK